MHDLGQHISVPVKTFEALAGERARSQSVNWPAYAGRGGAEDGAVLFVFVEAASQPIWPAKPVAIHASRFDASSNATSIALILQVTGRRCRTRKERLGAGALFNSTKQALPRTGSGG